MKKKNNYNKRFKKHKIIIAIIIMIFLVAILSLLLLKEEVKPLESPKEFYIGEVSSINAAANMLDYLNINENIIISPFNANLSMSLLYNGADNTTKKEIKKYFGKYKEEELINNLNQINNQYSRVKKTKYEKMMTSFINKGYDKLRIKDLDKMAGSSKEELVLLIKKIELSFEQTMSDKEIEKYKLNDKDKNDNSYAIKEMIDNLLIQYEIYNVNNNIKNFNGLYYSNQNNITLEKNYLSNLKKYNTSLIPIDFNSKESDTLINNALKEKANTQLTRAVSDSNMSPDSIVSINSLYFNYKWENVFSSANTVDEEFIDYNNNHYMIDMMHGEEYTYLENEYATGFIKNFEGNQYSFVAILPKEKADYKISELNIQSLLESKREAKTFIEMPKFSINSLVDLKPLFNHYDIKEIYSTNANLHQISSSNLHVDKMIQKESITIGEYGTEESTIKNNVLSTSIVEDNTKSVVLNRPFSFFIIENSTNNIILIGKYNHPDLK